MIVLLFSYLLSLFVSGSGISKNDVGFGLSDLSHGIQNGSQRRLSSTQLCYHKWSNRDSSGWNRKAKKISVEECKKECNKDGQCSGFVYNRITKICWMKKLFQWSLSKLIKAERVYAKNKIEGYDKCWNDLCQFQKNGCNKAFYLQSDSSKGLCFLYKHTFGTKLGNSSSKHDAYTVKKCPPPPPPPSAAELKPFKKCYVELKNFEFTVSDMNKLTGYFRRLTMRQCLHKCDYVSRCKAISFQSKPSRPGPGGSVCAFYLKTHINGKLAGVKRGANENWTSLTVCKTDADKNSPNRYRIGADEMNNISSHFINNNGLALGMISIGAGVSLFLVLKRKNY